MPPLDQLFLLSPAICSGQRAALLFNERASFFLARKLREQGATLGEVFSFLSGLYFRGKLTYARAFAPPAARRGTPQRALIPATASRGPTAISVITAGRGLVDPETIVRVEDLRAFAAVPIDAKEPRYRQPLVRDAQELAAKLPAAGRAV